MARAGFLTRLTAAVALTVAVPAVTAPPAVAQMFEQVALTDEAVANFIASYPAVKGAADSLRAKYNIDGGDGSLASGWSGFMMATGAWAELNAIVTPYGFTDFQTWLKTTISVATAYAFAKDGGAMDAQMEAAVAAIQNNPNIPEATRKMMIDQMTAATGAMGGIRPPEENLTAVKPYLDQLQALF